jgi:enoyl-CoA hydratase/3-hydroxyacyl-CoA dehydrogenase
VLQQLFDNLKKAQASPQVKAIVITGANGTFSGGFDITQFKSGGADSNLSENVNVGFLDLVETGPKPTVAAISNIALGGGCELAIACNARVATPGTTLTSRLHLTWCWYNRKLSCNVGAGCRHQNWAT